MNLRYNIGVKNIGNQGNVPLPDDYDLEAKEEGQNALEQLRGCLDYGEMVWTARGISEATLRSLASEGILPASKHMVAPPYRMRDGAEGEISLSMLNELAQVSNKATLKTGRMVSSILRSASGFMSIGNEGPMTLSVVLSRESLLQAFPLEAIGSSIRDGIFYTHSTDESEKKDVLGVPIGGDKYYQRGSWYSPWDPKPWIDEVRVLAGSEMETGITIEHWSALLMSDEVWKNQESLLSSLFGSVPLYIFNYADFRDGRPIIKIQRST